MSKTSELEEQRRAEVREEEVRKRREHRAEAVKKLDKATRDQLPRWKCHKVVSAAKIASITLSYDPQRDRAVQLLYPDDAALAPIPVDQAFMAKHNPVAPGYFVVYEDGYESWSPVETFEAGYTKHDEQPPRPNFDALNEGLIYREPIDNGDRHNG